MDNIQMPPVQPYQSGQDMTGPMPGPMSPYQSSPTTPGGTGVIGSGTGQTNAYTPKKDVASLVKTIVIVVLSLVSVTFIGLFIWMTVQYNEVNDDVNGQIELAVGKAIEENSMKMETEFAEREKEPYRDFSGPIDYGGLSFKYPKTWSLYVASDAAKGGDYQAYFNPIEVNPVSNDTVNSLRVTIANKSFEAVTEEYQRALDRKDSNLSVESITVAGTAANRYTGTIPNTELNGQIVIFKIRDKTVILQTDATQFIDDFTTLLTSVSFNE